MQNRKPKDMFLIGKIVKPGEKTERIFNYGWVRYCTGQEIRQWEAFDKKVTCYVGIYQNLQEVLEKDKWQGLDLFGSKLG